MRLSDLTKNVSNMSDEELRAHVQSIRQNKYVLKPAVKKRQDDVVKKEKNTGVRTFNKMLNGLTDEQKAALLKSLEGDNG